MKEITLRIDYINAIPASDKFTVVDESTNLELFSEQSKETDFWVVPPKYAGHYPFVANVIETLKPDKTTIICYVKEDEEDKFNVAKLVIDIIIPIKVEKVVTPKSKYEKWQDQYGYLFPHDRFGVEVENLGQYREVYRFDESAVLETVQGFIKLQSIIAKIKPDYTSAEVIAVSQSIINKKRLHYVHYESDSDESSWQIDSQCLYEILEEH
jgi:hypothetical protein